MSEPVESRREEAALPLTAGLGRITRDRRIAAYVLVAIGAAALLWSITVTWRAVRHQPAFDFYIYYVNAQIAGRDVGNIYAADTQESVGREFYLRALENGSDAHLRDATMRRRLDSVSSPFLYTSFGWLNERYERARRDYRAVQMATFVGGALLLCLAAGLGLVPSLLVVAVLVHSYFPFHGDLIVGNVNSMQLALIGVAIAAGRRSPLVAGFFLGVLLAFKPNLIAVLLVLVASRVVTRDLRRLGIEIAGGAAGGVAAFVATSLHYGSWRVWIDWLAAAGQFWERLPPRSDRNVAPALSLYQEYGTWPSYLIASALLFVILVAMTRSRRRDDAVVAGLGVLVYLLSATVVWVHYMVLALPLAITLLGDRRTRLISASAVLILAGVPLEMILRRSLIPAEAGLDALALLLLFAAGIWSLAQNRDVVGTTPTSR